MIAQEPLFDSIPPGRIAEVLKLSGNTGAKNRLAETLSRRASRKNLFEPVYLCFISRGLINLKVSAVSAGSVISRLPVNPAPAVPAPAPIRPPIKAPLPPPARPPMSAPPPAPPPIITALRLPLPLLTRIGEEARISYSLPFTLREVSVSSRAAPPLKRPADLASLTIPVARAPLGIAIFPSTSTGLCTVAAKVSPLVLVLDERVWSNTTVRAVSAGTTSGLGVNGMCIPESREELVLATPGVAELSGLFTAVFC